MSSDGGHPYIGSPRGPMTPLTAETRNEDKPRALPDAEFDSPTAGEGRRRIPLTKDDGAETVISGVKMKGRSLFSGATPRRAFLR